MIYLKTNFSAVGALVSRYAPVFEYMFILSKGKVKTFNPIKDRKCSTQGSIKSGNIRQKDGSFRSMSNQGWVQTPFGQRYNVWEYTAGFGNSTSDNLAYKHPAIFPEKLANDHIISWSNENDIILDPFMGSGTTAKMAILNKRKFIGFELSQEYVDIANQRIKEPKQFMKRQVI